MGLGRSVRRPASDQADPRQSCITYLTQLSRGRPNESNALANLNRYTEAIAAYNTAIAIKPDDNAAYFTMGKALTELNRYAEAIAAYNSAIAIDPGSGIARAAAVDLRDLDR